MVHYFNFSVNKEGKLRLDSSSSSTTRPSCAVVGNWCNFLDAFNSETESCQSTYGCLRSWSWSSWSWTAWGTNFDMNSGYSFVSSYFSCTCGCTHSSVRWWFHPVCFDEHTTACAGDCFSTWNISHVDQSVVVRAKDVNYSPFLITFTVAGAQNLPPPRPPLRPLVGCLISGCLATTDNPILNGWAWFATVLSGE